MFFPREIRHMRTLLNTLNGSQFQVCGTILFNVTILNLVPFLVWLRQEIHQRRSFSIVCSVEVIAIYGNEYEQVNAETELHFMKERAKYCVLAKF